MDGMLRSHASEGVHDPLCARVLVLAPAASPADACVFVSLEVCLITGADADRIRDQAAAATGIPADHMIIAATHTHSGPATVGLPQNTREEAYVDELVALTVTAVTDAAAAMCPVEVGYGIGREDTISHYRRLLAEDGSVVMNWEPYPPEKLKGPLGEVDPDVLVLKLVNADAPDQTVALMFNHAGHPNVMSGDNYLLSGDYPGYTCRLLEEKHGGVALFVNGAQGTMDIDGLKDREWAGVERAARALADAVDATIDSIETEVDLAVRSAAVSYSVPARPISPEKLAWAEEIIAVTGGEVQPLADGVGDDYKANLVKRLHANQDRPVAIRQTGIAVGDCAFVSFPGELFTEIGVRIKQESPFPCTGIIDMANGSIGYVPTVKAIGEGGYAVATREVGDEAEEIIHSQSRALLERLRAT